MTRHIVRLITQHKIPLVHRPLLLAKPKGTSSRLPCSASILYSFRAIYSRIYPRGILSFDQRRHIGDDAARCSSFRDWRSWREVKEIMGCTKPWDEEGERGGRRWSKRERNGRNRSVERDARCHLATHASSFMPLDSGDRTWHGCVELVRLLAQQTPYRIRTSRHARRT